jgi:signal transduction histidine kinase
MKKLFIILLFLLSCTLLTAQTAATEKVYLIWSGPRDILVIGIFLGIFVYIIFYNVLLFISMRQKTYLYYVFFLVSFVSLLFFLDGFFEKILPANASLTLKWALFLVIQAMIYLWGSQFSRYILKTMSVSPVIDKLLIVLICLDSLYAVYGISAMHPDLFLLVNAGNIIAPLLGALHTVTIIVVGIVYAKKKIKAVGYYFIGWLSLAFGVWFQISREYFPVFDNFFTQYAIYFGGLVEVFFFSLTLTKQFNRMKVEREEEKQRLIQADKLISLGTLSSAISHEIANPLSAISGNAAFLSRYRDSIHAALDGHYGGQPETSPLPYQVFREKIGQAIVGITKGSQRIEKLVSEMRSYYVRSTSDVKEKVLLNSVIESALTLFGPEIRKNSIELVVKLKPDLPAISGNVQRIEQVIVNLVMNARNAILEKFAQCAGSVYKGIITVSCGYDGAEVFFSVGDNGTGMDEDTLEKTAQPFFTTRPERGGSGLGLYISKKIITEHSGVLAFQSQAGEGTTVTVRFRVTASGEKI